eukprot:GHVS01073866.1.p1 GENE.GHVS01073866.1~~GHVS01073866.1.p1  ORF type:complete len:417 (+),score=91.09 GHVS01073866.1:741-1991(+)
MLLCTHVADCLRSGRDFFLSVQAPAFSSPRMQIPAFSSSSKLLSRATRKQLAVIPAIWLQDNLDTNSRQRHGLASREMIDLNCWLSALLPYLHAEDGIVLDLGGGTYGSVLGVATPTEDVAVKFCATMGDDTKDDTVDALALEFLHHLAVYGSQAVVHAHAAMVAPQRELAAFMVCCIFCYVDKASDDESWTIGDAIRTARSARRQDTLEKAAARFGGPLVEATLEFPFCQLVTELCHHGTLLDVSDDANLDNEGRCMLVANVLEGVDALHKAGRVHADLGGAREVTESSGTVRRRLQLRLADLRQDAAAPPPEAAKTRTKPVEVLALGGTRPYAAPEMLPGRIVVSEAADVWSVGVMAANLLSRPEKKAEQFFEDGAPIDDNEDQLAYIFGVCGGPDKDSSRDLCYPNSGVVATQ